MTKRALSLLLTLVMVLSLCVPALAADEFEAETAAVAEEEQAPVAPAALDEPEALVEEEADEAEEAVAYPGSDPVKDPATEADYTALHTALVSAKAAYDAAEEDNAIGKTYYFSEWLEDEPDEELIDFVTAYEDGQAYWTDHELNGTDYDRQWITTLATAITTAGGNVYYGRFYSGNDFMTQGWDPAKYAADTIEADESFKHRLQSAWYDRFVGLKYVMDDVAIDDNYAISKVMNVLAAVYKDKVNGNWIEAIDCWLHSYKGAPETVGSVNHLGLDNTLVPGKAVKPTLADAESVKTLLNQLAAAIKGATDDWGANLPAEITAAQTFLTHMNAALLNEMTATGLWDYVTLDDLYHIKAKCKDLIEDLEQRSNSTGISSWRLSTNRKNLFVFLEIPDKTYDDMVWHEQYDVVVTLSSSTAKYGVRSQVNWSVEDPSMDPGIGQKAWGYVTVNKYDLLNEDTQVPFAVNDVLTVQLKDKDGNVYDTETITITADTSPRIEGSGFKTSVELDNKVYNDAFYLTFNGNLNWFANDGYTNNRIEVTRPDGTKYNRALVAGGTLNNTKADNAYWVDDDVKVGTYSISYYVDYTNTQEGTTTTIGPKTTTITVGNISTYAGYAKLTAAIAAAAGYQQKVVKNGVTMSDADVKALVARQLSAANAIVAAYATTPANNANCKKVTEVATNLADALAMLTTAGDQTELDKALAKAKALVQSDYNAASWAKLQEVVKDGEKVQKDNLTVSIKDTKAIARAAKLINDAIADLVVLKADLSGLQALVASVPSRLSADNYTAESKAAVNTATAAANVVLGKKTPTRSEVAKAMADLQAALNALKVIPAGDPSGVQPPKGGTGWVYDPTTGDDYYFIDGVMKKDYWVGDHDGASKWNFWYYLGADGKLVKGFHYINNPNGTGWYMLQENNKNGCRGVMLSGWQYTNTAAGTGYFTETRGTNYGKCTQTNVWGAYSATTGLWGDGLSHR